MLLGALIAVGAHAQAPKTPRIGVLHNGTVATNGHLTEAFKRGLAELGYVDGKNVAFELRHAEGQLTRLPTLAQELKDANVDLVFAPSALAANAMKKSGTTMPIVFALAPDPIDDGFVASLARPGGNMTGLTSQSPELGAKRFALLRETLPSISKLAVLYARPFPGVEAEIADIERATRLLGKDLVSVEVKRSDDLAAAFAEIARHRADAMIVIENPIFFTNRAAIVELAAKHRVPAIYRAKEYAVAGGLMSYGADYADLCRRAASYVDRIVRGAKPGDLPVEQPVKFELVINPAAAKAIGVAFPRDLLVRADVVVD
jgi:putative ABC transport system substrate-binding protein